MREGFLYRFIPDLVPANVLWFRASVQHSIPIQLQVSAVCKQPIPVQQLRVSACYKQSTLKQSGAAERGFRLERAQHVAIVGATSRSGEVRIAVDSGIDGAREGCLK
jgi:hypothetical protein